ncbi:MAG: hypothetical protein AABX14_05690 [Candidatus Aenigmatarchaeota archaeon]
MDVDAILNKGKGQMFMIGAIFIVVGFVLLKGLLSLPILAQEKNFQDTSYLDRSLKNIRSEYQYASSIASMQGNANASAVYLYNISTYMRSEFDSKIIYVFIFYNGTTGNFSTTIGNFLQNNLSGTINFTNSIPTGRTFALNDSTSTVMEFNSSAAIVNVTLNYTLQNNQVVEKFYFNSSTRNYVAAFFDISLQESGFFVRSKSTYNRTW